MVNILVLPLGQGCPRHDFGGDVVVLALAGQVEFVVHDGGSSTAYTLEPNDMLRLPAGVHPAVLAVPRVQQFQRRITKGAAE
jgi:quercetin dioxygenase-like cupin family protein